MGSISLRLQNLTWSLCVWLPRWANVRPLGIFPMESLVLLLGKWVLCLWPAPLESACHYSRAACACHSPDQRRQTTAWDPSVLPVQTLGHSPGGILFSLAFSWVGSAMGVSPGHQDSRLLGGGRLTREVENKWIATQIQIVHLKMWDTWASTDWQEGPAAGMRRTLRDQWCTEFHYQWRGHVLHRITLPKEIWV